MTGLEELRTRAETLRWVTEMLKEADAADVVAHMLAVTLATETAIEIIARDYAEPAEEEPDEPTPEPDPAAEDDDRAEPQLSLTGAAEPFATEDNGAEAAAPSARDERDETILNLGRAGSTLAQIATAIGASQVTVSNRLNRMGTSLRALRAETTQVPLPNPAEQQAAEDAAQAEVADADLATIRHWLATHGGLPFSEEVDARTVTSHANKARRLLGLPPFRLIRKPIGAPSADELDRMARAGEAR